MRRRKVNKKDLIDGNAGLIFGKYSLIIEKTFAHRDQVYGEIQKKEKKQEEK